MWRKAKRERALIFAYIAKEYQPVSKAPPPLDFLLKRFPQARPCTQQSGSESRGRADFSRCIWCLTKQEGLTEVNWRQPALDLRVGQITIWDRLHADSEISISRDQYSKSKTSRVKKSYSSSLKKKKRKSIFFSPIQKATSKIIFGSMPLRLFKSLYLLGPYIIPIAPIVSSPPFFSQKWGKLTNQNQV